MIRNPAEEYDVVCVAVVGRCNKITDAIEKAGQCFPDEFRFVASINLVAAVVIPDGQTVGERVLLNIEKAYLTIHRPPPPAIDQTGGAERLLTADSNQSKNGPPTDA